MLAIIGGRQTGKTTCLIAMSNETGYPILTATRGMAEHIELMARKMNVQIPPVLSLSGMPLKEVVSASIDGVALVKAQPPSTDLAKLGLWEAFKLWREERKRARSGGDGM